MSQTPRKFSEKIAILERKSKTESDDFMAIMQDVKRITSHGPVHSQQTTPSSTPYPCSPTGPGSSSAIGTPSAIESPIDANNLHVMHPLASLPQWQRSGGGSLPNVHAMVQQKPMPQMNQGDQYHQNWLYWQQTMHAQGGGSPGAAQRTRSPGSSHYHPYRTSSGNVAAAAAGHAGHRNERVPPLESHMMTNNVHLQLPDPSWSRARSDPAIHMNTMNTNYYNPQPNAQFQQQYQQQLQMQQQWAAQQMQNGIVNNQQQANQQQFYNGAGTPQATTPTGVPQPQTPNSQPGSTASSASSVPISMSMNSPQQSQAPQQIQYNGGYMKQSPVGSPVEGMGAVGSLPNMHAMPNQQQFKTEPQGDYYNYDEQSQQQPLNSAPATMQQYCNGGNSVYAYNNQPQMQQTQYRQQLTMPQGGYDSNQSASAPTSPAQSFTTNPLQQPPWTPTRHYSASPDNMGGIPRVTLTRVEGNTECFQEFQDLCLDHVDNDLQQVLMSGEDHFDPAAETQLINSTR